MVSIDFHEFEWFSAHSYPFHDFHDMSCRGPSFMMIFDTVSDTILFAYIVQKLREEKDEKPTIYTRACGFVAPRQRFVASPWH